MSEVSENAPQDQRCVHGGGGISRWKCKSVTMNYKWPHNPPFLSLQPRNPAHPFVDSFQGNRGIETWCSKNVTWWGSETTKGGGGGGGEGGRRFTKTIPVRYVQKWNLNWVFPPSSSSEGSHTEKNWLRITNIMMSFLTRPPNSNTDNQAQTNFNQTPAKLDLFSCGGSSARNFVAVETQVPNGWWTPEEALMLSNALMKQMEVLC